jgi:hypothetical protein
MNAESDGMTEGAFQDLIHAVVDIQDRSKSTADKQTLANAIAYMMGWDRKRGDLIGFRDAWYEIGRLLDIPAMAMSPKQVHESVVMPKLRSLIAAPASPAPERKWTGPGELERSGYIDKEPK